MGERVESKCLPASRLRYWVVEQVVGLITKKGNIGEEAGLVGGGTWRWLSDTFSQRHSQEEASDTSFDIHTRSSGSGVEMEIWLSPAFGGNHASK